MRDERAACKVCGHAGACGWEREVCGSSCRGCPAVRHSATPHLVAATTDLRVGTGVMAGDGSGEEGGQSGGGGERGEVKVGSQLDLTRGHRHPPRV